MLTVRWLNHRLYVLEQSLVSFKIINLAILKLVLCVSALFIFPAKHRTWILLYAEGKITL